MSTDDTTPPVEDSDLAGVPTGPPWTLDVLADLHAGRYPAEVSAELRRLVADDPWAASVLAALDATVDQLSLLPTPRMPERFALRLDAAIAGEYRAAGDRVVPQPRQGADQSVTASPTVGQVAGASAPPQWRPSSFGPAGLPVPPVGPPLHRTAPTGPPTARPRPLPPSTDVPLPTTGRSPGPAASAGPSTPPPAGPYGAPVASLDAARTRRRRWVGGLAAAAAVIAIGTATVASLGHSGDTGGLAAPSSSAPGAGAAPAPGAGGDTNALQLDPGRFGDALKQIEGKRPVGSLQDAATYSRCLAANAINPSAVQGVTSATFDGKPAAAIAVVIDATHSRVVVVGAGCGINGAADQLAAQTVTR